MKNKRNSAPIVGGTSLVTVFAVVCLVVFTLLTLSTVIASQNLATASHDAVKGYYNADAQAEAIFSKIRSGNIPDDVTVDGDIYSYQCNISDTQAISVVLEYSDDQWDIIKWCSVTTIQ